MLEFVKEERTGQPRVGTRKLYQALESCFEANGLKVGRDKLFDIQDRGRLQASRQALRCAG